MLFATIAVPLAIEYFISGATAAITLYCGTKPVMKRGRSK